MQIKNSLVKSTPYDQNKINRTDKAGGPRQAQGATDVSGADRISISSEAALRSTAVSEANTANGVRAEKVADLKRRISEGTYQPDNRKIAENLVKQDLDLLVK